MTQACKQGLIEARLYSSQLITDNQRYIQKLSDAQYELNVAEALLKEHLSNVAFLE